MLRAYFPTRSLGLLLMIGFVDLIVTAMLHARGEIVEMNPIMRVFIDRSEWLFVAVKALTLFIAWAVMARYARTHLEFVRKACLAGSGAYLVLWTGWFFAAR